VASRRPNAKSQLTGVVIVKQLFNAILLALLMCSNPSAAQPARPPAPSLAELQALGLQQHSLQVAGRTRWFLAQAPADATRPAPVLLVLHGGGESMRRILSRNAGASQGWPALAQRENALLLIPNASNADNGDTFSDNQNWNDLRQGVSRQTDADDVAFLLALLNWAHQQHRTDRSRVYVSGASNGGMMSMRMLMQAPEAFAAAAVFVASLPVDESRFVQPAVATPLFIANGTEDPLVRWGGGTIAGDRGLMRSVSDTVAWWIKTMRAEPQAKAVQQLPKQDNTDPCLLELREHAALPGGAPVVVLTMRGGGHSLPSAKYPLADTFLIRRYIGPVCRSAEGPELAWQFLQQHRR
jgi:polyhydroxybutyrate depolymerase